LFALYLSPSYKLLTFVPEININKQLALTVILMALDYEDPFCPFADEFV
jgi:hypothetical protein